MSRRYTCVRIALGSLLLCAAGLKLYGLSVSAVPRVGWFAQPWVQLAAVEWELVLGVWLLSGAYPRLSWLAAVLKFATFAGISSRLGSLGVASCGCFGTVPASPWSAFVADVVVLVFLFRLRPPLASAQPDLTPAVSGGMKWVAGVAVLMASITLGGSWLAGSPSAALARLRGEPISVSDRYLDFGPGHPGDQLEASVIIYNWSEQPVRLVGGTSDCSCTAIEDLPVVIEPFASTSVSIQLHVPVAQRGQLTRTVHLHTDCPEQSVVSFRVSCRIE